MALFKEIKQDQIFGRFKAWVWTIEYQKRGLPHLHLLLFLHPEDRFLDAQRIDEIISAELPDPESDPDGQLTELVQATMIHGPCGLWAPYLPCIKDKKVKDSYSCIKGYPRQWQTETIIREDGYPLYRRRMQGTSYLMKMVRHPNGEIMVDNRWVVPYNPYLLRRYQTHINVEVCASVQAVKYIYKYIYKGNDRTSVQLSSQMDEIDRHMQGRYIGPSEAIYRLFEYPMHEELPSVIRLSVHLPNQQSIFFRDDATPQQIRHHMETSRTTLMAFFEYNLQNTDGRSYLYQEFPTYFVFHSQSRCWQRRRRGHAIGRIYHCNPFMGERYYLRLLLTIVKGPQSFEHLRTINGIIYDSFQAAC